MELSHDNEVGTHTRNYSFSILIFGYPLNRPFGAGDFSGRSIRQVSLNDIIMASHAGYCVRKHDVGNTARVMIDDQDNHCENKMGWDAVK